jgi:hypothetical protein
MLVHLMDSVIKESVFVIEDLKDKIAQLGILYMEKWLGGIFNVILVGKALLVMINYVKKIVIKMENA